MALHAMGNRHREPGPKMVRYLHNHWSLGYPIVVVIGLSLFPLCSSHLPSFFNLSYTFR
jgi:hypothetical protein